jgi:LmbE family N-acetylglucosaminyl deacetylase
MSDLNGKGKTVLVVGAHPDDVDFGCGATMAKLASEGAKLYFVVATEGNRGSRHHQVEKEELVKSRRLEQENAAKVLGAQEVIYLEQEDGNLIPDIVFKEKIVRLIRKYKPDMIFTHDPAYFYVIGDEYSSVNHHDHRATGEAVLDAVYPLSRDLLSFPEHQAEGLTPHKVLEVYMFNFHAPNYFVDVTNFIDTKVKSIWEHKSQVDDPEEVEKWAKGRASKLGEKAGFLYAEGFTRLVLK